MEKEVMRYHSELVEKKEEDGHMSDEWDYFPEKGSDWKSLQQARCLAVAEFRNILDTCATAPSRYEAAVDDIHRCAVHGLKHLGADLQRTPREASSVSNGGGSPGSDSPQNSFVVASGAEKWTVVEAECQHPNDERPLYHIWTGEKTLPLYCDDRESVQDICDAHNASVATSVSLAEARIKELENLLEHGPNPETLPQTQKTSI